MKHYLPPKHFNGKQPVVVSVGIIQINKEAPHFNEKQSRVVSLGIIQINK